MQVVPSIENNNEFTAMSSFGLTKNCPSTQDIRASKVHWLGCYIVDLIDGSVRSAVVVIEENAPTDGLLSSPQANQSLPRFGVAAHVT